VLCQHPGVTHAADIELLHSVGWTGGGHGLEHTKAASGGAAIRKTKQSAALRLHPHQRGIDPGLETRRRLNFLRLFGRCLLQKLFENVVVQCYSSFQRCLNSWRARARSRSIAFSVFPDALAMSRALRFSQ
jgi:hypothetical protein